MPRQRRKPTQKTIKKQFYNEIGPECDKEWVIEEHEIEEHEKKMYFSHPKYGKKKFDICVIQELEGDVVKRKLYPLIVDTTVDPYMLGFNTKYNTQFNTELISNKFCTAEGTRKGKRLQKYTEYRKYRDNVKKEFEDINKENNNHKK